MGRHFDKLHLDRLVCGHLPEALRFATRLTGEPDSAEEVVEEALLRVARSWQTFRGESEFRTWFFRIVINAFRDRLAAREPAEQFAEGVAEELPDAKAIDPAAEVMAAELGQLIAERVSALPPRQREVLVLIAYEGLSPAEVAGVLGITEANVHATLHLARKRLRKQLAFHLAEEVR